MVDKEYLSIADFAKRAGITRQAVYKKLSTELSNFVKQVDNKKVINIKALEIFGVNSVDNLVDTFDNQVDSSVNQVSTTILDLAEHLQRQYEQLQEQNKRFDRLIDTLENELEIKNNQIRELSSNLSNNQILLNQQQKLNAHALLSADNSDQYEKGYNEAREKFLAEMKKTAHILNEKYPEAVDYLIAEAEKL